MLLLLLDTLEANQVGVEHGHDVDVRLVPTSVAVPIPVTHVTNLLRSCGRSRFPASLAPCILALRTEG